MTIGIYALYWEVPDIVYIGQSSRIEERYKDHLRELRNETHCNTKMINIYKQHGNPIMVVLDECGLDDLNELELHYIKEFDSYNNGLNRSIGPQEYCFGESHPNSINNNKSIQDTFLLLCDRTNTHKQISKMTGVSIDTIKSISCGKNHGWLKEIYPDKYNDLIISKKKEHNSGEQHSCAKHSNTKIIDAFILYLVDRKLPYKTISNNTGISVSTLTNITSGLQHKWLKEQYPEEYNNMRSNTKRK